MALGAEVFPELAAAVEKPARTLTGADVFPELAAAGTSLPPLTGADLFPELTQSAEAPNPMPTGADVFPELKAAAESPPPTLDRKKILANPDAATPEEAQALLAEEARNRFADPKLGAAKHAIGAFMAGVERAGLGRALTKVVGALPGSDQFKVNSSLAPYYEPQTGVEKFFHSLGSFFQGSPFLVAGGPVGAGAKALGAGATAARLAASAGSFAAMNAGDTALDKLTGAPGAEDRSVIEEGVKGALGGAALGLLGAPASKLAGVARAVVDPFVLTATESAYEAAVHGQPLPSPGDYGVQSAGQIPVFLALNLLHMRGLPATASEPFRKIADAEVAPADRLKSAQQIARLLGQHDPEQAQKFWDTVQEPIQKQQPLDLKLDPTQGLIVDIGVHSPGLAAVKRFLSDNGRSAATATPVGGELPPPATDPKLAARIAALEADPEVTGQRAGGLNEDGTPRIELVPESLAKQKELETLKKLQAAGQFDPSAPADELVKGALTVPDQASAEPHPVKAAADAVKTALDKMVATITEEKPVTVEQTTRTGAATATGEPSPRDALSAQTPVPLPTPAVPASVAANELATRTAEARAAGAAEGTDQGREALRRVLEANGVTDESQLPDPLKASLAEGRQAGPRDPRVAELEYRQAQLAEIQALPAPDKNLSPEQISVQATSQKQGRDLVLARIEELQASLQKRPPVVGGKTAAPLETKIAPAETPFALMNPDERLSDAQRRRETSKFSKGPPKPNIIEGIHKAEVEVALTEGRPANAVAVDRYGIKLPANYGRQGNVYAPKTATGETPVPLGTEVGGDLPPKTEAIATPSYRQNLAQYVGERPTRQTGQTSASFRQDETRYASTRARHKAAVAATLADGTLTPAEYDAVHATDYGKYGSAQWAANFKKAATAGERTRLDAPQNGTDSFPVERTAAGKLLVKTRSVPLTDTPSNRAKLHAEAEAATRAGEFDRLGERSAFGQPTADIADRRISSMKDKTGRQLPVTANLNETLWSIIDASELKKRRVEVGQKIGATPAQLEVLGDNTTAGRQARSDLLERVQKFDAENGPPTDIETAPGLRAALIKHGAVGADGKTPMTGREARLVSAVVGRLASNRGMSIGQFFARTENRPGVEPGFGPVKGELGRYDPDLGGYILRLVHGKSDASTVLHEAGHAVLKELAATGDPLFDTVRQEYERAGGKPVQWTDGKSRAEVDLQEWHSDRFEQWLKDGQPANSPLARVFARVADWMREIYGAVTGTRLDGKISPELRGVFESYLEKPGQRDLSSTKSPVPNLPDADLSSVKSGWEPAGSLQDLPASSETKSISGQELRPIQTGNLATTTVVPGSAKVPEVKSMAGSVGPGAGDVKPSSLPDNLTDAEKNRVRSIDFAMESKTRTAGSLREQAARDRANLERHQAKMSAAEMLHENKRITGAEREAKLLEVEQADLLKERADIVGQSEQRPQQSGLFQARPRGTPDKDLADLDEATLRKPVTGVTGELPSAWRAAVLAQRRRLAEASLRGVVQRNVETGWLIVPSKAGRSKIPHVATADADFAAIANLPQLIKDATLVKSRTDRQGAKDVGRVHLFVAPFEYQGEPYRAKLTVLETSGKKLYALSLTEIEKLAADLSTPSPSGSPLTATALSGSTSFGKTVADLVKDVKPDAGGPLAQPADRFALESYTVEQLRAEAEHAKTLAERRAAEDEIARRQAARLTGTTGDLGQQDLFGKTELFQREEPGKQTEGGATGGTTIPPSQDRYEVREKDGKLWVWNTVTDQAHKPGLTIYSGANTPESRARLENNAQVLNDTLPDRARKGAPTNKLDSKQAVSGQPDLGIGGGEKPPGDGKTPSGGAAGELPDSQFTALATSGKIEPTWKRLAKGRLFRDSVTDTLRRAGGPTLNKLADALSGYRDTAQARYAKVAVPLQDSIAGLPKDTLKRVRQESADYFQARENAKLEKPDPAAGNPVELLAKADPATKKFITAVEDFFEKTGNEDQRLGVQVYDHTLNDGAGGWRKTGNLGREYLPRIVRSEVADVLHDPSRQKGQYKRLVSEYAAFRGLPVAEAEAQLLGEMKLIGGNDFLVNAETARTGQKFPATWYEHDAMKILPKFADAWADRISQVEHLGQARFNPDKPGRPDGPPDAVNVVADAWSAGRDPLTRRYVESIGRQVFGKEPQTEGARYARTLQNYATATKLANWWSSLRNLGTLAFNTMPEVGVGRTLDATAKTLLHIRESMHNAEERGTLRSDIISGWLDSQDSGAQRKIVDAALKIGGFTYTERFNRMVSTSAGINYARWGLKQLEADPTSRASILFKAKLRKYGVDVAKLQQEGLAGDEAGKVVRGVVNTTQFSYDERQVPGWANTPQARFLFQFQKFGLQQLRRVDKDVFTPAFKGVVVDGKKRHDIAPLLLSAATMVGAGASLLALRDALFAKRRKDATWIEINNTADEDKWRAVQLGIERLFTDAIYAGGAGVAGDWYMLTKDATQRARGKNPLEPPSLSGLKNLVDLGTTATQQGKLTVADLYRWVQSEFPLVNYGGAAAMKLANKTGIEWDAANLQQTRQDQSEIKALAQRWADERGIERPAKGGATFTKTPLSPVYNALQEALLLGDVDAAKQVRADAVAGATTAAEKTKLLRQLAASAGARRPLRLGGLTADVQRGFRSDFRGWLQQRRPDLAPVLDEMDTRYVATAHAAGLGAAVDQAGFQDRAADVREKYGAKSAIRELRVKTAAQQSGLPAEHLNAAYDRLEMKRVGAPSPQNEMADAVMSGEPPAKIAAQYQQQGLDDEAARRRWEKRIHNEGLRLVLESPSLRGVYQRAKRNPGESEAERTLNVEALLREAVREHYARGGPSGAKAASANAPTVQQLIEEARR